MPYTTEFVDADRGVVHTGRGVVLGAEIFLGASAIHSRAGTLRYGIVDLTEVTELHVSTAELELIASENQKTAVIAREVIVAVAAPGNLAFGLSRMWEVFAANTGWVTKVVRSRTEAQEWLQRMLRDRYGASNAS
jgi:hypothetical protein